MYGFLSSMIKETFMMFYDVVDAYAWMVFIHVLLIWVFWA